MLATQVEETDPKPKRVAKEMIPAVLVAASQANPRTPEPTQTGLPIECLTKTQNREQTTDTIEFKGPRLSLIRDGTTRPKIEPALKIES
jgi:hypothetical protein